MVNATADISNPAIAKLMEPRFICIGDFPGNPFKVWDKENGAEPVIIYPNERYPESYFRDGKGNLFWRCFLELDWNERRKESELPEYVKLKRYPESRDLPTVFRVVKPLKDFPPIGENTACIEGGSMYDGRKSGKSYRGVEYRDTDVHNLLPATQEEFRNQPYTTVPKKFQ